MKILKRLVLAAVVLAVLLAGGVILLLSQVDRVAKVAIEQGGTFATGTQTTVNDVSIGLFSGKFGLSGLSIANPEGFKSPAFMSLGSGGVDLSLASLSGSTIEVRVSRSTRSWSTSSVATARPTMARFSTPSSACRARAAARRSRRRRAARRG
ncbi:MAG: hypothetical protein ACOYPS_03260 [Phycisphaerales bacterium]